jgi:hypothetical protein
MYSLFIMNGQQKALLLSLLRPRLKSSTFGLTGGFSSVGFSVFSGAALGCSTCSAAFCASRL